MRKTWKKVLATVCAAAMVVTSFSPALQTQAATVSSGDAYMTAANGLSVKVTATYNGADGEGVMAGIDQEGLGYSESTANIAHVVDGDMSTGVIFRSSFSHYSDWLAEGDYIQVEFEEAINFKGVSFNFNPNNANDTYNDSTLSYTTDGSTWTDLGTIASSTTMSYQAEEAIAGVKAVKLTNTVGEKAWVRLMEVSVDAEVAAAVLDNISVTAPTKVEYFTGEELDTTGMVVTATYSDGTSREVTAEEYTVSGYDSSTAGTQTITVTYEEKTATFTVNVVEEPEVPTIEVCVVFPSVEGESVTLEAENYTEINNNESNDNGWPLQASTADWASGGYILDAMNGKNADTIDNAHYRYNAPVAGTYTVVASYNSGDANNVLAWSETDGKIESGSQQVPSASNSTMTFTMKVVEAGEGTLIFAATAEQNAPQLDKFVITLTEAATSEEPEIPTIEVSEDVKTIMSNMTLREKVTQMLMVDFRYWDEDLTDNVGQTGFTVMNDQVAGVLADYKFGALIYFAQNLTGTEQSYNLTQAVQAAAISEGGLPMIISADQEGGSVYRLGTGTALPGNMALGATFDTENAKKAGQIIGSELSSLGINTNLAPVVDVNNNANNPVIGLRSYGDDATAVGEMASASIAGMAEYNVIGCAKHFPGHGDTATDSHYGLPMVDKSLEVLKDVELKPYEVAIDQGIEMIMTAHILYPQLEADKILSEKTGEEESLPATMSDDILTGLLKEEMGFEGIIVTDAMNMAGISGKWNQVQSVKIAIAAGVDMICMPCTLYNLEDLADLDAIINGVVAAVESGEIPEARINDAVARILNVKENRGILAYDAADYTLENAKATVGSDENRATEREIAAKAVTVVKNENNVLPLNITADTNVLMLVPYNNERAQMLMAWNRAVEAGIIPYGAEVDYFRFSSGTTVESITEKLEWADVVIMNSEISSASRLDYSSWLSAFPKAVTEYCKENGKISVISSVDKPYDVQLYPDADAIVAAYGCKGSTVDPTEALVGGVTTEEAAYGPNIIAAVEVILGTYGAQGKLPVNIPQFTVTTETNEDGEEVTVKGFNTEEIVYARGYGLTYEAKEAIVADEEAKAVLEAAVAEYKYNDISAATEETAAAFTAALETAEALLADENATDYAVKEAAAALKEAAAALKTAAVVEIDSEVLKANATANSEQLPAGYTNDGGAAWAFDGDDTHWWHSRYQDWDQKGEHEVDSGVPSAENPIWIQTGFGKAEMITKLTYATRQGGNGAQRGKDYSVAVANLEDPTAAPTDEDFVVVKTGVLENTGDEQEILLDEAVKATHVRLIFTSVHESSGTGEVAARKITVWKIGESDLEITVDKSALQTLTDTCAAIDTSVYTEESAAALEAALTAATDVLEKTDATSAEVYAAIEALEAAQAGLEIYVEPIDPADDSKDVPVEMYITTAGSTQSGNSTGLATDGNTETYWEVAWGEGQRNPENLWFQIELDEAIELEALRYYPRFGENYTSMGTANGFITGYRVEVSMDGETWNTAAEGTWALEGGWKIAEFDAPVTAKYVRLIATETFADIGYNSEMSIAEIRVKATGTVVNKVALKAAIAEAESLNAEDYVDFTAVTEALAAATEVAADAEATQEAVDAAAATLNGAIDALERVVPPVTKEALEKAIADAAAYDETLYTEESWAALEAAVAEAEAVMADEEATQAEVDAAAEAIGDAIEALEEKPVISDEVIRISGTTRYETGYEVADEYKAKLGVDKFDAVVVATGKNFADALSGSYLAVVKNAPILLTNGNDDNVAMLHDYIKANVTAGGKVYILGGEAAVPASVAAIEGYDVVRLSGPTRYDTNLAILAEAGITGDELIVATGKNFADSLSASAVKKPILLVKPGAALSDGQKAIADAMNTIYIVGGEGAVDAAIAEELAAYATVERVYGATRQETSVAIAEKFLPDAETVVVASAKNFPDGLCGGPLAAAMDAPLLLTTDGKTEAAADYTAANGIASGYVLGGEGALANESVVDVFALESADEIIVK